MRRSDYSSTEIHIESLKMMDRNESSDFFADLHRKSSSEDKVGEKQVDTFLEMPLLKSLPTKGSFISKVFQQLLFNTKLPYYPQSLFSAYFQWVKICRNPNVLV